MPIAMFTKLRIKTAMEDAEVKGSTNHLLLPFLETLRKASKDLQTNPIFTPNYPAQTNTETLLQLLREAGTALSANPNLCKLDELLCDLRALFRNLKESQGFNLKSLIHRQITSYKIYRLAFTIEAEIQAYIDRVGVQDLVLTLRFEGVDSEEMKVEALKEFEKRLSHGFDREFQELVLRAKVFSILESLVSGSNCPMRIREHAALCVVALVRFNKDVFVGLVLMGPTVEALISMGSCCSIQVLCCLIRLIRIPLIDKIELDGEVPRIVSLFSSEDLLVQVAAMDCVCEIAYYARREVIEAMLEQGLIDKLVELERSKCGDNLLAEDHYNDNANGVMCEAVESNEDMEKSEEEKSPFASCVVRFTVQVEVGEVLSPKEKKEFKREILRRVREACASEAEAVTIVSEVLWGSSPRSFV